MFDPEKTYKTKTHGYSFRFYADDGGGDYPIHGAYYHPAAGWQIQSWTRDLYCVDRAQPHALDLVEVSPYDDFEIDEPVMVRDSDDAAWARRHFAGVSNDGLPMAWPNGMTSFSISCIVRSWRYLEWDECRRPTEEELNND